MERVTGFRAVFLALYIFLYSQTRYRYMCAVLRVSIFLGRGPILNKLPQCLTAPVLNYFGDVPKIPGPATSHPHKWWKY